MIALATPGARRFGPKPAASPATATRAPVASLARWLLAGLLTVQLMLVPTIVLAEQSAKEALADVTDEIMRLIDEAASYADEDPDRYYGAVLAVLDPVVDYRGFARGVMGEYASGQRYRALDEAGREKLREQLERFTEVMRSGLVRTYSKGLLAFGGSRVELDYPGEAPEADADRAVVRQLIHSGERKPYAVVYQMSRADDGHWQMRNLIVENVNLGQIYRNQFEAAARKYEGDLDQVIDNWSVESEAL
jgi:phospholipid transport system substrate-binding protein